MTEDEAKAWIDIRYGAAFVDRLATFVAMVVAENDAQNLIAPSTIPAIWVRHVVDSVQLAPLGQAGVWIDIGTGGGFPGIVIGLLRDDPIILVEPRKRRAAFLAICAEQLGLANVRTAATTIEHITDRADVISARAVASVEKLLQIAAGCANRETRWLLPRGRLAEADVVELKRRWHGVFHVEQSLTDMQSSILVIDGLARR